MAIQLFQHILLSKAAKYKIKIQKSTVFMYTSNNQLQKIVIEKEPIQTAIALGGVAQ